MPIIYTNNSSGAIRKLRNKKPHKSYVIALKNHVKWLKSLGLNVNDKGRIIIAKREKSNILVNENRLKQNFVSKPKSIPHMGNGKQISWKEKQERLQISSQYSVAPAYNKGPYMVVAKQDLKTMGRKI